MPQEHVLLGHRFLSSGVSEGHRVWDNGRYGYGSGLRANRIRLISWLENLRALCLRLRLFPFAGAGMRRLGLGREERSLSFPFNRHRKTR